jgi:hypothetical protein
VPITFLGLVTAVSNTWKTAKPLYDWATDAALRNEFEKYLSALEHRRVLYAEWRYEDIGGVLSSLSEILDRTRDLRANHHGKPGIRKLLGDLVKTIQEGADTIRGCDLHTPQGEYMAYRSLLKIRSEMAKALAILCGTLKVNPRNTDLEQFIMNMALVKPRS